MLMPVDASVVQIVQMAKVDQPAVLEGSIVKQSGGGNTIYELQLPRKVRFTGSQCPHTFTQDWVQVFPDPSNEAYASVHGVHRYRVQLSCSMAGPIIEVLQLQK